MNSSITILFRNGNEYILFKEEKIFFIKKARYIYNKNWSDKSRCFIYDSELCYRTTSVYQIGDNLFNMCLNVPKNNNTVKSINFKNGELYKLILVDHKSGEVFRVDNNTYFHLLKIWKNEPMLVSHIDFIYANLY